MMSKCILQNILEVLKYFNLVSGLCAYGIYKCILRMLIKRPILEGYPQLPAGLGRLIGVRLHSVVQQTVLSAYRVPRTALGNFSCPSRTNLVIPILQLRKLNLSGLQRGNQVPPVSMWWRPCWNPGFLAWSLLFPPYARHTPLPSLPNHGRTTWS